MSIKDIRFAGAQVPCSNDLNRNVETAKQAINWASKNKVDYLVTPEGFLSGYSPDFDSNGKTTFNDVLAAEQEVVAYAAKHGVGQVLGTLWHEDRNGENFVRENQQRYYGKDGNFLGKVPKAYLVGHDANMRPRQEMYNIELPFEGDSISALGLICNDFWGGPPDENYPLPMHSIHLGSNILLHSTNGFRDNDDSDYYDLMEKWHDANLRMYSWTIDIPILSVDNSWNMRGTEHNGPTSSTSGVLLGGKFVVEAPRIGTQYFYYDFNEYYLRTNRYSKAYSSSKMDIDVVKDNK